MPDIIQFDLRDLIATTLSEQDGVRLESVGVINTVHRPFSRIIFIRALTSGGERKLVLKQIVHHSANKSITDRENQAQVEFLILRELYPKFLNVPGCNVPRPILVVPEQDLYIMEFVDGQLLVEMLNGIRLLTRHDSLNRLVEFYRLCGLWLRKLREFTGVQFASPSIYAVTLERCEQKLNIIDRTADPRCPRNLTERIRSLIRDQIHRAGDRPPVAGRHGDFGNWNIIAGANGITVIDFLGYQEDLLPMDFLKMMTNFEDEKAYLLYSKQTIDALKNGFLAGYGKPPEIALPVALICEILHRVCCICAKIENRPQNLMRRIENNISLKHNIAWFLNDNRKSLWPAEATLS